MKRAFGLILCLSFISPAYAGAPAVQWKEHNINKIRIKVTNLCAMGDDAAGRICRAGHPYCEWPAGSYIDYFGGYGLWVGAMVNDTPMVDAGYQFTSDECYEFWPTDSSWDTIYTASILDDISSYDIPFWEDYTPVSEQDFICQYQDSVIHPGPFQSGVTHKPMGLKVIQRSYAWSYSYAENLVYFDYLIINIGNNLLKDTYVGYWLDGNIGSYEVAGWGWWMGDYSWREFEGDSIRMFGMSDLPGGEDGTAFSPIGIEFIDAPKPIDSLVFSFHWYQYDETVPVKDLPEAGLPGRYDILSDGTVMENETGDQTMGGGRCLMGFGPFQLPPRDTLKVTMAIVFGCGENGIGLEGVKETAEMARWLYHTCELKPPPPPPSPPLKVTPMDHGVKLNWKWESEDPGINPEEFIDSTRRDGQYQDFEGYRVYKSTQSSGGPWTLLAEYDIVDNLGFNIGLEYEYIDSGLVNGIPYWYAVISFDMPDTVAPPVPSLESAKSRNVATVYPGSGPTPQLGKVAVVPNPYRGDVDYTAGIEWEGPPEIWTEDKRRIQFINLPGKCTIRIYSLAGDLIKTIEHNDPLKGYEDWNLLSRVNQAISSGIYIFSVEDRNTGDIQLGKFVVIK